MIYSVVVLHILTTFGIQVQGFSAWWIWRNYYLVNLPTIQKKVRVLADWIIDIFFKLDVTMLEGLAEKQEKEKQNVKSTKTVGH